MDDKINIDETIVTLHNERLKVDMAVPGAIYKGSRFDWTGFITQITLDDKHTFCVSESLEQGQGTGGSGICNEFGIVSAIGYDEAKAGEKFPKIGVGLLTRMDGKPYFFANNYIVDPFQINVNVQDNAIEFVTEPFECNGYAFSLKKIITLYENQMTIAYKLDNKGSKQIKTEEYCHNFIGIDNLPTNENYRLKISPQLKIDHLPDILNMDSGAFSWNSAPEKQFYCCISDLVEVQGFFWELINYHSKIGIREECGFPISKFALWGSTHVISPECFINLSVKPGEVKTWFRKYTFFHF